MLLHRDFAISIGIFAVEELLWEAVNEETIAIAVPTPKMASFSRH